MVILNLIERLRAENNLKKEKSRLKDGYSNHGTFKLISIKKKYISHLGIMSSSFQLILSLTLITQLLSVYQSKNYTTNLSYYHATHADTINIVRKKRAPSADCTTLSIDVTHSLIDSICCDPSIPIFVDDQLNTNNGMGAISRAVQQRVQAQYNVSFEMIISESDFVVNTYYSGPRQCKFETERYFVALYQTPIQYDITDVVRENILASVDSGDPLGWKESPLLQPEQAPGTPSPTIMESTNATCSRRTQVAADEPYAFSSNECCDTNLNMIIKDAAELSRNALHLGDAAKYIQRRIQLQYGTSYEVIMSKSNFALSTFYHGINSCKIQDEDYYYLAYATPYDPFNIPQEDYLASIDAEEPLGSTRNANLRGDFPDIRIEPSAGEDLSLQPNVSLARILMYEGAGGPGRTSDQVTNITGEVVFTGEENLDIVTVINGFHVGGTRTLGMVKSLGKIGLPPGTHCDRENRTGDICCNSALFETMSDAFYELSSSPQFSFSSAGNIASRRVQLRFQQSYEVIVSSGDFSVSSYAFGDQICKYRERGFVAIAYATPVQYDITDTELENYYSMISARDNLGAFEPFLPGQRPFHTPLAIYTTGVRAGLPVGSHCLPDERAGSKCCSVPLFEAMQAAYEMVINQADFDPYDLRLIARAIQNNAEERLQMSVEVIISKDDFAYSSAYFGNNICKYRVDRYYLMAYVTPIQYAIHTEFYEDTGAAISINCPAELTYVIGDVCCDGTLHYEMIRVIDEAIIRVPVGQHNRSAIATAITRNSELRFNTTFETVLARSNFLWKTHVYNERMCKIQSYGYNVISIESSKEPPPLSDLTEVIMVGYWRIFQ
ncbi:ground-like domain protein [Dictyocaulus viviparus]|uniref:Ground-like domain protein n=1 Tax=Dictyocaulus viviparus TaxID=29172 RepID=A0A0D8X7S5_DICVI|nr:ground-like domain protein [Dictyocaulus viviparus]